MNSSFSPTVPKLLQEIHSVSSPCLIEPIYGFTQISKCFVPVMMTHFLFKCFPSSFFWILFGRVSRELNDTKPGMIFQPLLHLVTCVVRCLVYPQHYLSLPRFIHYHFKPSYGSVRILPIDYKWRYVFACPKMQSPVNVLSLLTACGIGYQRLLTYWIPPLGNRPFQIYLALIACKRCHQRPSSGKSSQNLACLQLKSCLLKGTAPDIKFASSLIAQSQSVQKFASSSSAVAGHKSLLDQVTNSFKGPPAAHLR